MANDYIDLSKKAKKALYQSYAQFGVAIFYTLIALSPIFRMWDMGNGGLGTMYARAAGIASSYPTAGAKAALAFVIINVILSYFFYRTVSKN